MNTQESLNPAQAGRRWGVAQISRVLTAPRRWVGKRIQRLRDARIARKLTPAAVGAYCTNAAFVDVDGRLYLTRPLVTDKGEMSMEASLRIAVERNKGAPFEIGGAEHIELERFRALLWQWKQEESSEALMGNWLIARFGSDVERARQEAAQRRDAVADQMRRQLSEQFGLTDVQADLARRLDAAGVHPRSILEMVAELVD